MFAGDGSQATQASLSSPSGIALDVMKKLMYIADTGNARVRVVDMQTGMSGYFCGSVFSLAKCIQ